MNEAGEDDDASDELPKDVVRGYYEAIDAHDYDRFADLLAPGVVHERPDRTIEGRETLVGFMRDDRPNKDTSHEIETVYRSVETTDDPSDGNEATDEAEETARSETKSEAEITSEAGTASAVETADRAVRGRLLDADGEPMFAFVDAFEVESASEETNRIARIRTYTR